MILSDLFNPSSLVGAYFISITSSLVVGLVLGFFSGKNYEKKKTNIIKQKGNNNINIQNSKIGK